MLWRSRGCCAHQGQEVRAQLALQAELSLLPDCRVPWQVTLMCYKGTLDLTWWLSQRRGGRQEEFGVICKERLQDQQLEMSSVVSQKQQSVTL